MILVLQVDLVALGTMLSGISAVFFRSVTFLELTIDGIHS